MASLPSSATKSAPGITVEYFLPQLERVRRLDRADQLDGGAAPGQASPVTTSAKEPHSSTAKSRPRSTPPTWWSTRLAPVIHGPGRATPTSTTTVRPASCCPIGPMYPLTRDGWAAKSSSSNRRHPTGQPGPPVSGQQDQDGAPGGVDDGEALQEVGGGDGGVVEEGDHLVDARASGGVVVHLARFVPGGGLGVAEAPAGGRLDVGRVPASRTADEVVLPHRRGDHELVVHLTPDGAGLGLDRRHVQPQPGEDPQVGVVDDPVGGLHGLLVDVEGVGVAHDQLAGAQQPEAGPRLVPELDLDLVDGERELTVGVDLRAHRDGDDLLVGRTEHEGPAPGLEGHGRQRVAPEHGRPAAQLPQLPGVQGGEEQLLAGGGVELLADDRLDAVQDARVREAGTCTRPRSVGG